MILRFKDTSGVVLFTLPNPSELEVDRKSVGRERVC